MARCIFFWGGAVSQGCRSALREKSLLEALQGRVAEWCWRQFFRDPCRKAVRLCGEQFLWEPCCGAMLWSGSVRGTFSEEPCREAALQSGAVGGNSSGGAVLRGRAAEWRCEHCERQFAWGLCRKAVLRSGSLRVKLSGGWACRRVRRNLSGGHAAGP
jgi:hypothetical protein